MRLSWRFFRFPNVSKIDENGFNVEFSFIFNVFCIIDKLLDKIVQFCTEYMTYYLTILAKNDKFVTKVMGK